MIKIFVDQGHSPGGVNGGAEGFGLREQDITYRVGAYLADILRADPRFEVKTSRDSIDQVLGTSSASSLSARVTMAEEWGADYFLSIHTNANENPNINGTEAYVFREGSAAYTLAGDIVKAIVERVGTRDNRVRVNPALYVLRRTSMPAVLIELAYITNAQDAEKLENDQPEFAQGIYNGLVEYFGFQVI